MFYKVDNSRAFVALRSFDANSLRKIVLTVVTAMAAHTGSAAVIVTLSSPTEIPTVVSAYSSLGGTQRFQSTDTGPFDQLARSSGGIPAGPYASASARLQLIIDPERIESSFSGDAFVDGGSHSRDFAGFGAGFSLDIVADTSTAFFFEATTILGSDYFTSNHLSYRFYTPNSNDFDFPVVAAGGNTPVSKFLSGSLKPGVIYRLVFRDDGGTSAPGFPDQVPARPSATSRLSFIPEPTPIALLVIGLAISSFARKMHEKSPSP